LKREESQLLSKQMISLSKRLGRFLHDPTLNYQRKSQESLLNKTYQSQTAFSLRKSEIHSRITSVWN